MSIPKLIHIIWLGSKPMPNYHKNWQKLLPEYRILYWNEEQCAKYNHYRYINNTIQMKRYANASNLLRLLILRDFGGIYLDTDVEIIKNFDGLLHHECFAGKQTKNSINNAVLGSIKCSRFVIRTIDKLLIKFNGSEFPSKSSPDLMTEMVKNDNTDISIYPEDWFYPYFYREKYTPDCITKNTVTVHHWAKNW